MKAVLAHSLLSEICIIRAKFQRWLPSQGFAAAFGAPIGGVLFALEEATSFWSQTLMWRGLLCTSIGCFTLSILKALSTTKPDEQPGGANYRFEPGMLTLNTDEDLNFTSEWELLLCAIEGIMGGVLGALFVKLHTMMAAIRPKPVAPEGVRCCGGKYSGRLRQISLRFAEVAAISIFTSLIMYGLSYLGSDRMLGWACRPDKHTDVAYNYNMIDWFYCDEKDGATTYNDVATIFLTSRENAVLQLIEHPTHFSYFSLLSMTVSFFGLMVLSFGAAFPAGIFMPTILIGTTGGAMFGRIIKDAACLLAMLFGKSDDCFGGQQSEDSPIERAGPYALLGAVALLGGVQRSSLSLVVIIVEGTGKVDYLLPIILTTICAKWAGDRLNHGIYHTVLAVKRIPFLQNTDFDVRDPLHGKTAYDLLSKEEEHRVVVTLPLHCPVRLVSQKIRANPLRNGFPVVERKLVPGATRGAVIHIFSISLCLLCLRSRCKFH
eukprot:SAG11_NODE_1489_length_4814_cov_2.132131_2_plen_491_part_00